MAWLRLDTRAQALGHAESQGLQGIAGLGRVCHGSPTQQETLAVCLTLQHTRPALHQPLGLAGELRGQGKRRLPDIAPIQRRHAGGERGEQKKAGTKHLAIIPAPTIVR
jgi:hypothetical protein